MCLLTQWPDESIELKHRQHAPCTLHRSMYPLFFFMCHTILPPFRSFVMQVIWDANNNVDLGSLDTVGDLAFLDHSLSLLAALRSWIIHNPCLFVTQLPSQTHKAYNLGTSNPWHLNCFQTHQLPHNIIQLHGYVPFYMYHVTRLSLSYFHKKRLTSVQIMNNASMNSRNVVTRV